LAENEKTLYLYLGYNLDGIGRIVTCDEIKLENPIASGALI
jgi:hypothetical protein